MSEFLAYYESSVGTYMPIVVIYGAGGKQDFKELKKNDLERLPDSFGENGMMGGWLHRNAGKVGLRDNWQRRYAIFRGPYLFYFQNAKSQSPVGVIPLENCEVYTPGGGVKSFTESNIVRGGKDGGYEFEIRHESRNNVHLAALNETERDMWVDMIQDRTGQINGVAVKDSHKKIYPNIGDSKMQNISVTRSRLNDAIDKSPLHESSYEMDMDNFSGVSDGMFAPPPPPSSQFTSHQHSSILNDHVDLYGTEQSSHSTIYHEQQQSQVEPQPQGQDTQSQQQPEIQSLNDALAHSRIKDEEIKVLAKAERQKLQHDLAHKIMFQQEGRKREAEARERVHNKKRIELARIQEAKNPLTLAEMFRYLLSFANEELCEEPDPDSPLQFPHLKGHWAENMLSSIYRRYCKTTGFMSLEEFVEFMEDTAVLRTHVPHDELDEPLREFQSQLDPVVLLSTVPRNLGYSESPNDLEDVVKTSMMGDNFRLNFAQFYQILLRITHVVYPDLYAKAPAHAFNKFLQESILPLSCWAKGHNKRGSTDTLVTDERIVLLLMTYAPNLWRVFLAYAQDCHAKIPSIFSSPYPDTAKQSEKYLFGPPPGAPNYVIDGRSSENATGVFMTEASCLKFCQDYGLMPHLMNRTIMKDTIFSLNRPKTVSNRPKPKEPQAPTVFFQKTKASIIREQMGTSMKAQSYLPMHFADSTRNVKMKQIPLHLSNPTFTLEEAGGLGFSEFIELIARIALEGMEAEAYNVLFPTPFSRILGILSVWGVADLKKLEEVRLINRVE